MSYDVSYRESNESWFSSDRFGCLSTFDFYYHIKPCVLMKYFHHHMIIRQVFLEIFPCFDPSHFNRIWSSFWFSNHTVYQCYINVDFWIELKEGQSLMYLIYCSCTNFFVAHSSGNHRVRQLWWLIFIWKYDNFEMIDAFVDFELWRWISTSSMLNNLPNKIQWIILCRSSSLWCLPNQRRLF